MAQCIIISQPAPCGNGSIYYLTPLDRSRHFFLATRAVGASEEHKPNSHSPNSFTQTHLFLAETSRCHSLSWLTCELPESSPIGKRKMGALRHSNHWYKGQGAECRKSRKHSLPIVSVSSESRLSWPKHTRNHPQLAGLYLSCSWILQLPFPIKAARGKAWLQQHQQGGIPPWHSSCVGHMNEPGPC